MMLQIVMVSIPERSASRARTLESLARTGIDIHNVTVFEQQDPKRGGRACCENFKRAIESCDKDANVLFLEDDLLFAHWFPDALRAALSGPFQVTTFYCAGKSFLSSKAIRYYNLGTITPHIFSIKNQRRYFGSQSLLLKPPITYSFSTTPDYLDRHIATGASPIGCCIPNPVQHAGAALKSTWSPYGKPHTSQVYRE